MKAQVNSGLADTVHEDVAVPRATAFTWKTSGDRPQVDLR